MKSISFSEINNLRIDPTDCIEWATTVIKNKNDYKLPPKTSIKFNESNFFNTMPSLLPDLGVFGVKIVSRFVQNTPSLRGDIILYDYHNGELLALMDGTWITAWRTGAVAAITINTLKRKNAQSYAFIGLGNTARTTLLCLDSILNHTDLTINLLAYKNQHNEFIDRFKYYKNIHFRIFQNIKDLFLQSDVVVSCVTYTNKPLAEETDLKPGILVVPVHTRGFQNCDLAFDKIFCDHIEQIKDFKSFEHYKSVTEMTDVLNNPNFIRNDKERIIAYNVGISVQDIYFAKKIYDKKCSQDEQFNKKFWV